MKYCDKNKEWSYLQYWDVNNLYDWAMLQKLPVNNFELREDEAMNDIFFEVDVQYTDELHGLHNDLRFLSERIKIRKVEKLVASLHDKTEYVIHIRNLRHALNHKLFLKKVRVIK